MSSRTRVRLLAGLAALLAAAGAAGVVLLQRESDAAGGPPALELSILVADDIDARALRAAERAYELGRRAEARAQFEAVLARRPDSVEAAVGAAVAAWPDGTLERLRALAAEHPASGLVRLHIGLALYAGGDEGEAVAAWREAKRLDPDTPSAVRAEDLLHPEMAPGRPFYYPDEPPPAELEELGPGEQLAELERRAEAGEAGDWLLYGLGLQRAGRNVSARQAYERALELSPDAVEVQVAAAVAGFDKDEPSRAFSRLGPLARQHPDAAVVRFHLGILLLWIRQVEEAREQLRLAVRTDPGGVYGVEANRLLSRLEEVRT